MIQQPKKAHDTLSVLIAANVSLIEMLDTMNEGEMNLLLGLNDGNASFKDILKEMIHALTYADDFYNSHHNKYLN